MIYIVSKDVYQGYKKRLKSHHWIDLPNGMIALSGEFHSAEHETAFLASGAISFEHICKSNPASDYPDAVTALSCHGICSSDSTFSAHKKLKAIHPLF